MDPSPPAEQDPEFDHALEWLFSGLVNLYPLTKGKATFKEMTSAVAARLAAGEVADKYVDAFVDGKVTEKKLAHHIETAVALATQANNLWKHGSPGAWTHLAEAYFVAGMATLHTESVGAALKRAAPFAPLKQVILENARFQCPAEKWPSPGEIWKTVAPQVEMANELLEGQPGYSRNTKAAFNAVVKENREFFETLLSKPIKPGRPAGPRSGLKCG